VSAPEVPDKRKLRRKSPSITIVSQTTEAALTGEGFMLPGEPLSIIPEALSLSLALAPKPMPELSKPTFAGCMLDPAFTQVQAASHDDAGLRPHLLKRGLQFLQERETDMTPELTH
jgi:hypothetical protein